MLSFTENNLVQGIIKTKITIKQTVIYHEKQIDSTIGLINLYSQR